MRCGFGEGEGVEAEAGEEDSEGVGDDFVFDRRDGFSDALGEGDGEASCNGLTGPVGRRGGAGLAVADGDGDGDVAAKTNPALRQASSAKMKERDLMGAAARPP